MELKMKELSFLSPMVFFFHSFETKVGWEERCLLRKLLVGNLRQKTKLGVKKEALLKRLLLPGKAPKSPLARISISHSLKKGAFLWTRNEKIKALGLDIEQTKRVQDKTVKFISSRTEWEKTPHPSLLWVAKEAGVKATKGPVFLKDIEISGWKKKGDHYLFLAKNKQKTLKGLSFFFQDLSLAIVTDET